MLTFLRRLTTVDIICQKSLPDSCRRNIRKYGLLPEELAEDNGIDPRFFPFGWLDSHRTPVLLTTNKFISPERFPCSVAIIPHPSIRERDSHGQRIKRRLLAVRNDVYPLMPLWFLLRLWTPYLIVSLLRRWRWQDGGENWGRDNIPNHPRKEIYMVLENTKLLRDVLAEDTHSAIASNEHPIPTTK